VTVMTAFEATFRGERDQVRQARRQLREYLRDCPAVDDAAVVLSEFATNAILHSRSRHGEFEVRAYLYPGYVWLEVEDMGGPWNPRPQGDDRGHGLAIVAGLAGEGNWGIERTGASHRFAWARLELKDPDIEGSGKAPSPS
jgi:anti-sigma regulatory factor (Ser/Thr protein kinase)